MKQLKRIVFLFVFVLWATFQFFQGPIYGKKQAKEAEEQEKTEKTDSESKKKEPINESDFQPILIGALLETPGNYLGKKIKFRGKFSSFTTLALDYEPALRKAKNYISICIFRPDSMIPLSELKMAIPIDDAKDDLVVRELEEGDLLEIYGQVFSAALDEPWVDVLSLKKIAGSNKNDSDKLSDTKNDSDKSNEKVKEKELKKKKKK